MKLPYQKKFTTPPGNIDIQQIVNYFNLELALEGEELLDVSSFKYMGLYEVAGYERVYWSVDNMQTCAVIKPFDNSYIIEMEYLPKNARKIKS